MQAVPRIYADTSVFGGVCDDEFDVASRRLFEAIEAGQFHLVTSEVVRQEIQAAPEAVRTLFASLVAEAHVVAVSEDALRLRDAYHEAGILAPQWSNDALHVALATVARCDAIVSWNFRHIVHFRKIPLYNAVNTLQGFGPIAIHSPLEVVGHGDSEEDV